jgi:hypothetical protein
LLDRAPFSDYDNATGDAAAPQGDTQARPAGSVRMLLRRVFGRANCRALIAGAALALAGCAGGDQTVTGSIPAASTGAPTIAFESVDGPPRPVFDRLVAALSAEAERRSLPVVTHTGPSTYRVRAYLATLVEKKKKQATLSWVWEVFDSTQNRAFRVAGHEALGTARADVWAQCDDAMLMRVAAKGFDELVARLGPLPTPDTPSASGPAIAFVDPGR